MIFNYKFNQLYLYELVDQVAQKYHKSLSYSL